jgi:predicted PurR-regulated permease PerM
VAKALVSPTVATGSEATRPPTAPDDETADAPRIDALRVAGVTVAVVAVLFAIRAAKDFCIAVVVGLMIGYALEPIVAWLARHRVPRSVAAALVLLTLVAGVGGGVYSLEDEATAFIGSLPVTTQRLREVFHRTRPAAGNAVGKVEQLANEIERSASEAATAAPPPPGVMPVQIQEKPLDVRGYLWSSSLGLATLLAQAALLLFLAYFFLASGDLFRRKLVRLIGPSLTRKRVTVQVLEEIDRQIQRFLLVRVLASVLIGVASALAFGWMGLDHAVPWGITAGLFNSIPYFGPGVVTVGVTLDALVQHNTLTMALGVAAISLALASLDGFLLVPWLISRTARMNEVAVFLGLLFWGWMWGALGMLLAVPIMMIVKAICDRIDDLQAIGELLGE